MLDGHSMDWNRPRGQQREARQHLINTHNITTCIIRAYHFMACHVLPEVSRSVMRCHAVLRYQGHAITRVLTIHAWQMSPRNEDWFCKHVNKGAKSFQMDSNTRLTSDMMNDSMMDNTPKASVPVNSERSAVLSDRGAKLLARKWLGLRIGLYQHQIRRSQVNIESKKRNKKSKTC